jgi:hypothetical protein
MRTEQKQHVKLYLYIMTEVIICKTIILSGHGFISALSGDFLNFFLHSRGDVAGGEEVARQLTLSVLVIGPLVLVALHIAVRGRVYPTILCNENFCKINVKNKKFH